MSNYINNIIQQGEHQQLDFKFEISDSKKIARTLVAFANTDGGRLLIGVKDNGRIAGIRTDEEYYMLEAAANMYCKPPVPFNISKWDIDGKAILEVIIEKSKKKPHKAPSPDNKWMVYIRSGDQNLLANTVLLKLWSRNKKIQGTFIHYSEKEKILLDYLEENSIITIHKLKQLAGISRYKAEILLVNLLAVDVLKMEITEKETFYSFKSKS